MSDTAELDPVGRSIAEMGREIESLRAEVEKKYEVIKTQLTVLEQQDAELQAQDNRIEELEERLRSPEPCVWRLVTYPRVHFQTGCRRIQGALSPNGGFCPGCGHPVKAVEE